MQSQQRVAPRCCGGPVRPWETDTNCRRDGMPRSIGHGWMLRLVVTPPWDYPPFPRYPLPYTTTCRDASHAVNETRVSFQTWRICSTYKRITYAKIIVGYSGPQKSWPLLPCISYGSKGHDFCDPLYANHKDSSTRRQNFWSGLYAHAHHARCIPRDRPKNCWPPQTLWHFACLTIIGGSCLSELLTNARHT